MGLLALAAVGVASTWPGDSGAGDGLAAAGLIDGAGLTPDGVELVDGMPVVGAKLHITDRYLTHRWVYRAG